MHHESGGASESAAGEALTRLPDSAHIPDGWRTNPTACLGKTW